MRDHRDVAGPIVAHIDSFPIRADRHRFGIATHVDGRRDRAVIVSTTKRHRRRNC